MVQAAELAITTGTSPACLGMLNGDECFSDALFESQDAKQWRALLAQMRQDPLNIQQPTYSSSLFHIACLSQEIVRSVMLDTVCLGMVDNDIATGALRQHYERFQRIAASFSMANNSSWQATPMLLILWHYCCVVKLVGCSDMIDLCRLQTSSFSLKPGLSLAPAAARHISWLSSPRGRLAVVHCCNILHSAYTATDLAMMAFT